MKNIYCVFGLLGGVVCLASTGANADPNCPSGQYFRSGACANAQGNKGYYGKTSNVVVHHPVKSQKTPKPKIN